MLSLPGPKLFRPIHVLLQLCCWLLLSGASAYAQTTDDPPSASDPRAVFVAAHPLIRYAADPDFAPLDFVVQGRHQGLAKDYLDRIAQALGVRLERVPATSWSAALAAFQAGEVDLLSSAFVAPEREDTALYSQPWLRLSGAILMLTDRVPLSTLEALELQPVAVVTASIWQERLMSGPLHASLQPFADTRSALQALQAGKVVALVSDPVSALYEARKLGLEGRVVVTGQLEVEAQLALAIRPDWPELKLLIDEALEQISVEDEQVLRERWLPALKSVDAVDPGLPALPASNAEEVLAALSALPDGPSEARTQLQQAQALNQQADTLEASLKAAQQEASSGPAVLPEVPTASAELQQFLLWRTSLPERASSAELERLLATERASLLALQQALAQASLQLDEVRRRMAGLPLLQEQTRLEALKLSTEGAEGNAAVSLLQAAQRRLVLVRQAALQVDNRVLPGREAALEQQARRARGQVLLARQRVAALTTLQRDRVVREAQLRLTDMQKIADQSAAQGSAIAAENLALAQRLVELAQRYAVVIPEAERQAQQRERVAQSLKLTRERLSIDTHSAGLGQLLMAEQRLLVSPRQPRRQLAETIGELGALRLEQIELDNRRDAVGDGAISAPTALADESAVSSGSAWTQLDQQYAQRQLLDELYALTQRLQLALDATATDLGARIKDSQALRDLIDTRLLWLPTQPAVGLDWLKQVPAGIADLFSPPRWLFVGALLLQSVLDQPLRWLLLGGAIGLLWGLRRRVPARLQQLSRRTRENPTRGMNLTMQALLLSLLAASFWPGLIALLGELLQRLGQPARFSDSLGVSLQALAWQLYSLSALHWLTRPEGLTDAHFQWPATRSKALHRLSLRLLWIAPPLLLIGILEHNRGTELGPSTVGRIALITLVLALARITWKQQRPGAPLSVYGRAGGASSNLWWRLLHWMLPGVLVVLSLLLLAGYGPISYVVLSALVQTLMLVFAVMVTHALALRWLLLQERRLAERRYLQERQARAQESASRGNSDAPPVLDTENITLGSIASQTRRLLRAALLFGFALGLLWVWSNLLPALQALDGVALWSFSTGAGDTLVEQSVTLRSLLLSVVSFVLTFIAARNLPGLLEVGLLERFPVDAGTRYAITSVSRYVIVIAGMMIGIGQLGLRWGHLQWLAAALSVGLGFGLQEIFANFVSGLILLFERPFRVGDTITIGTLSGTVTRIRTRATTILDWDNKEIVVPNKTFITGDLTNWTLSDEVTRVTVAVGVAYESDPELVHRVLLEVAQAHPLVLKDPKPGTWLMRFGPSSLEFELRVHVGHIRDRLPTTSDLNAAVHQGFAAAGIEIPFPQVEMRQRVVAVASSSDQPSAAAAGSAEPLAR